MRPAKPGSVPRSAAHAAAVKRWQAKNRDLIKAAAKLWREQNPEKVKAMKKRYYAKYKDKLAAAVKKWRAENLAKNAAAKREWRKNNKERVAEQKKRYYEKHTATVRAGQYRVKFGITIAEYERLFAAQQGLCAICQQPPGSRRFDVDHCHNSKVVRGLLCTRCNRLLGYAYDNINNLRRAIDYLTNERAILEAVEIQEGTKPHAGEVKIGQSN
jgi:hypothetical protein